MEEDISRVCKRNERVKSIFDSDDSDEDKGFDQFVSKDDDLQKKIDAVCFSLSKEEKTNTGVSTDIDNDDIVSKSSKESYSSTDKSSEDESKDREKLPTNINQSGISDPQMIKSNSELIINKINSDDEESIINDNLSIDKKSNEENGNEDIEDTLVENKENLHIEEIGGDVIHDSPKMKDNDSNEDGDEVKDDNNVEVKSVENVEVKDDNNVGVKSVENVEDDDDEVKDDDNVEVKSVENVEDNDEVKDDNNVEVKSVEIIEDDDDEVKDDNNVEVKSVENVENEESELSDGYSFKDNVFNQQNIENDSNKEKTEVTLENVTVSLSPKSISSNEVSEHEYDVEAIDMIAEGKGKSDSKETESDEKEFDMKKCTVEKLKDSLTPGYVVCNPVSEQGNESSTAQLNMDNSEFGGVTESNFDEENIFIKELTDSKVSVFDELRESSKPILKSLSEDILSHGSSQDKHEPPSAPKAIYFSTDDEEDKQDEVMDVDGEEENIPEVNSTDVRDNEDDYVSSKKDNKGVGSDLATLSDVWDTVNIFKGPELVSEPKVIAEFKQTDFENKDSSDSGTEMSTNTPNKKSDEAPKVTIAKKKRNSKTFSPTAAKEKNVKSSCPGWELMEDESLFGNLHKLSNQSISWESLGIQNMNKVRVDEVFTDSDAEEKGRPSKKIKLHDKPAEPTSEVPVVKKSRRKRERATSINLPAIMLAFEKGWVREMVYRPNSSNQNIKADVYYYSPSNRKLRSRNEVQDYLTKNKIRDLNLQNFSFFKEPLGVGGKYENIRHSTVTSKSNPPTKQPSPVRQIPVIAAKKAPKKIAPKPPAIPTVKKPQPKIVKKVLIKDTIKKTSPKSGYNRGPQSKTKPSQILNSVDQPAYATHLYPANPPLTQARIITPLIRGEAKEKTFHCTPACEAGGGNVPNLQCVKCVCLFHSECCQMPPATVSIVSSSIVKFLCPNCYREEVPEKTFTPAPCFEPLAFDPPSDSEDEGLVSDYEHPALTRHRPRPRTPPLCPLESTHAMANQFSGFRTSILHLPQGLPSNAPIQQDPILISNSESESQERNNPALGGPLRPPSHSSNLFLYQPILPKNDNLLQNIYLPYMGPNLSQSAHKTFAPMIKKQRLAVPRIKEDTPTKEGQPKEDGRMEPKDVAVTRPRKELFKELTLSYHVIRRIFSYLSVSDLLIAARVCIMWRDLALNPFYWRSVRLRNICVKDWDNLVKFLERRQTEELDLRKMVISSRLLEDRKDEAKMDSDTKSMDNICVDSKDTEDKTDVLSEMDVQGETSGEEDDVKGNVSIEIEDDVTSGSGEKEDSAKDVTGEIKNETMDVDTSFTDDDCSVKDKVMIISECSDSNDLKGVDVDVGEYSGSAEKKSDENVKGKDKMDYIVSSVLNEHDYFGRSRRSSVSSHSSETTTTGSEQSDESDVEDSNKSADHFLKTSSPKSKNDSNASSSLQAKSATQEPISPVKQVTKESIPIQSTPIQSTSVHSTPTQSTPGQSTPTQTTPGQSTPTQSTPEKTPPKDSDKTSVSSATKTKGKGKAPKLKKSPVDKMESSKKEKIASSISKVEEEEKVILSEWDVIALSLSKMRSLQKLLIGPCDAKNVQPILSKCNQLLSLSLLNYGQGSEDRTRIASFDPVLLMRMRDLEELHVTSQKSFVFSSNFNFIKLQKLKHLTLKGLKSAVSGWPCLSDRLTHLYLSSIGSFTHNNWLNVIRMTDLVELELDGSGSDQDSELCAVLPKLTNLKRLNLLDWNVGPKFPYTLKKLHNIKIFYIVPAVESQQTRGVYAGRLMVILDSLKHLDEFIWGIQTLDIIVDGEGNEKIPILTMKGGKETGILAGEESRSVALESLRGFMKCRIPNTRITLTKVTPKSWIR